MEEPVHEWFELSYANYLTIPRSVLQSMPTEWQSRFVKCLDELDETIDWRPQDGGRYSVQLRDKDGKFTKDPLADYERGRRRIPHILVWIDKDNEGYKPLSGYEVRNLTPEQYRIQREFFHPPLTGLGSVAGE